MIGAYRREDWRSSLFRRNIMSIGLVVWWCNIIGVSDPGAIQIATGVFAGGSLLFLGFMILTMMVGLLAIRR
jgi:hypothetical protein